MKIRALFTVGLVALVVGCGGSEPQEPEATPPASGGDAQELFTSNCSSCHTLAAAGANGQVGPNLDQLRPGPDLVNAKVNSGGGAMPSFKGKLTPEQIDQIANYVADNAGQGE